MCSSAAAATAEPSIVAHPTAPSSPVWRMRLPFKLRLDITNAQTPRRNPLRMESCSLAEPRSAEQRRGIRQSSCESFPPCVAWLRYLHLLPRAEPMRELANKLEILTGRTVSVAGRLPGGSKPRQGGETLTRRRFHLNSTMSKFNYSSQPPSHCPFIVCNWVTCVTERACEVRKQ